MMLALKPYPTYQPVGLPWLDQIPSHWKIRRGKFLFRTIDVRSTAGEEELLTVSSERGVIPRRSTTVTMFKAESYAGYKLCWPGDLVINSLWAWARGLGVSQYHGIISSAYGVYRLLPTFQNYSSYIDALVRSSPFQWELQVRSKGIWISRLQLTDRAFLDAPLPVPPEIEQAEIVRFLHHNDQRIRRYILIKQKQIKLLDAQKRAVIRHVVTRGLDPNVRLKPSGTEWLGDVPVHWKLVPLKFLSRRIQNGATPPSADDSFYADGTIPWFGPSSIGASTEIGRPVRYLTAHAIETGKARLIQGPAILIIVIGATAGRMTLLPGDGTTNQQITAFELRPGVIRPELAIHQLRSAEIWLRSTASTATIPIIDSGTVARLSVAIPPDEEQVSILGRLSEALKPLELATSSAHRQIDLAREYRTRMTADLVTGKLDVRDALANLPDEVVEIGQSPLMNEMFEDMDDTDLPSDEELIGGEVVG